ncbi:MAG: hypothetical protein ACLU3N_04220 [Lachnospiraceae bacterium]
MTEVTLFSYITKEEQERMRVCFRMRETSFQNNETIMEYSSSMKKIGLILDGQALYTAAMKRESNICWMN